MAITTFRKEPAPPEVFLEEEHFDGGGSLPVGRSRLFAKSGIQQMVLGVHPAFRMLVLSPTADALEFSLAYGLDHFFGPWALRREDVVEVERVPVWYVAHDPIRIIPVNGPKWYFSSHEPGTVLACLRELGYPVMQLGFEDDR